MRKFLSALGLFLALGIASFSANSAAELSAATSGKTTWNSSLATTLQETWITVSEKATAYAVKIPEGVNVYVQLPGELWKQVITPVEDLALEPMPDAPDFAPEEDGWSAIYTSADPFQKIRFRTEAVPGNKIPSQIEFSFFDTRVAVPYAVAALSSVRQDPVIISRAEWGADESLRYDDETIDSDDIGEASETRGTRACRDLQNRYPDEYEIERVVRRQNGHDLRWPFEYSPQIKKVVVHHTASLADSNRDPQEILRATYAYHARSRGWGDIGYHYLIDLYGNIYEGRAGGDYVVAGHVYCSNAQTIGVALMGNFQEDVPTEDQVAALGKLLPFLAEKYELNLSDSSVFHGKDLPNLIGHRDLAATACPGENMYELLAEIRESIQSSAAIQKLQSIKRSGEFIGKVGFLKLQPEQNQKVTYKFKNTGNVTWDEDTWLYVVKPLQGGVSVHSQRDQKSYIAGLLKESSVPPGQTASFEVEILGGSEGGLNSLEFTPVVDERKVSSASVVQPVEILTPEWSAALQAATLALEQSVGKTALTIALKNSGRNTWTKGTVTLKLTADGKSYTAPLREDAVANRIGKFTFSLPALTAGKKYIFNADLLVNGKKPAESKTLVIPFSLNTELKAKLLPSNIVRAAIVAGKVNTEVKAMNSGGGSWKKETVELVISGPEEEFSFQMSESFVAKNGTARFPVSFSPKKKIGISRYTIRLESGDAPIPGGTGQLLVRRGVVLPQPPVTVTGKMRVRLDHAAEEATIVASGSGEVHLDGVKIRDLKANEPIAIKRSADLIAIDQQTGKVLRFIPATTDTILTISSWNRRPSWDTSGKLNDNRFRGTLEFRVYNDEMVTINEISLEKYLWGLAETSNATAWEKQKVMAIIARTYAAFYLKPENRKFPGAPYDGDDSPDRFQKYLGYSYELRSSEFVQAVNATAGKIVTYNGKLIKTPYFSQSDGRTLSALEVWGWTDTPYLQSVPDPYCEGLERLGHGVGLSGKGAEEAAKAGSTYEEIIKYYYQGVEIGSL